MALCVKMMGGCYTFHKLNDSDTLYRFMPINYLEDLIKNERIYLCQVTKWEDSWEFPSRFIKNKHKPSSNHPSLYLTQNANIIQNELYGICFSQIMDTDALWRIYSHNKSSVCIKTSVKSISNAVFNPIMNKEFTDRIGVVDGFIAPVQYFKIDEVSIEDIYLAENAKYYPAYMYPAFVKRNAFEHEHEVRLIIYPPISCTGSNGIFLKLGTMDFIEEIILDPRLNETEESTIRKRLKGCKHLIRKSHLYDIPEFILDNIDQVTEQAIKNNEPNPIGAKRWKS